MTITRENANLTRTAALLINVAQGQKKSRTANKLVKEILHIDWFHARGIADRLNTQYSTLLKEFKNLHTALYTGMDDYFGANDALRNSALIEFKEELQRHLRLHDTHLSSMITDGATTFDEDITNEMAFLQDDEPSGFAKSGVETQDIEGEPSTKPTLERIGSANKHKNDNGKQKQTMTQEQSSSSAKTSYKTDANDQGINAGFSLNIPIMDILKQVVDEKTDVLTAGIENKIKEAAQALQPNVITINNKQVGEVQGQTHNKFKEAMQKLVALGSIFLSGETGSGKTHLAKQLAQGLKLPFGFMSLTAGMSEAHLLGRMLMDGSYVETDLVRLYENGGVFLMDEVDSADANTLLTLNSALANGELSVPNRKDKPIAKRHKDFYMICSANTWGNGGIEYSGREILDKAFMNRFSMGKILVSYDTKLETKITDNDSICKYLQMARKALNGTQKSISTRTIIDGYKLKMAGYNDHEVIDTLVVDYTEAEKNKLQDVIEAAKNGH